VDAGAIAVIDGEDGTRQALEEAIHRSRAHGVGAVGLRNSNHFSMAMQFTPMGRAKKTLGTHEWLWVASFADKPPMALDIANTGRAVASPRILNWLLFVGAGPVSSHQRYDHRPRTRARL